MKKGTIYIVHCIDTEGPLYESLNATFERIRNLTGVDIKPTKENLEKVQNGTYPLGGYEEVAKLAFSKRVLNYNSDWTHLDEMLDDVTSDEFRNRYIDSEGNGWKYSWFIIDWAGCDCNPRCRDIGYNNIYNHYREYYDHHELSGDDFEWHAHPMSTYHEAHKCATSYINSPNIWESLCHRIIDCGDFPRCFRPGYHTERPDSHWFLEQFIPFDYANQSVKPTPEDNEQKDLADGRFGDWRRASSKWGFYHPDYYDYQKIGNCNRYIFRCLNAGTRLRLITQDEVNQAFEQAENGEDTVVSFCDHDFRDFRPDIDEVYGMMKNGSKEHPDIKWINSTAYDAALTITKSLHKSFNFDISIKKYSKEFWVLSVKSSDHAFGIQPYLAIKTKGQKYIWQNCDIQIPYREWTFTFDGDSIHPDDVELIGVASNSATGSGALKVIDSENNLIKYKKW